MERVGLSLTAGYAPGWGLWEGVRELCQNWHDGVLQAAEGAETAGQEVPPGNHRTASFDDAIPEALGKTKVVKSVYDGALDCVYARYHDFQSGPHD